MATAGNLKTALERVAVALEKDPDLNLPVLLTEVSEACLLDPIQDEAFRKTSIERRNELRGKKKSD